MDPLKLPARLGTLNAIDRSKQYTRDDNEELKRSLDKCWETVRLNEARSAERQNEIVELHSQLEQRGKLIKDLLERLTPQAASLVDVGGGSTRSK